MDNRAQMADDRDMWLVVLFGFSFAIYKTVVHPHTMSLLPVWVGAVAVTLILGLSIWLYRQSDWSVSLLWGGFGG